MVYGAPTTPPPVTPPSNPSSSTSPIPDSESDRNLTTTSISTSSDNTIMGSPSIQTLAEPGISLVLSAAGKRNDNITISIPGEGNVTLNYVSLVSGENLIVSALKTPSDLAALNITKASNDTEQTLSTLNKGRYTIVSTVFVIGPNDAEINGTVTVSIPYDNASLVIQDGKQIRMLLYTGTAWEDVTS